MTTPASAELLHQRAARVLAGRVVPMPLGDFWSRVAELGWASQRHDPRACAELLSAQLAAEQVLAMLERFRLLDTQLAKCIDTWAMQHEESLGLPADLQRELRAHVIGLGELAFGTSVQGPWRVKHRADRDDYLEGFGRSFELALERYPAEQLQALVSSGAT